MNFLKLNIFILLIFIITVQISASDKLTLHYFGSKTCGECHEIKVMLLEPAVEKHHDSLEVLFYDTEEKDNFELMLKLEKERGITGGSPQELFFSDTFLLGFDEIMGSGGKLIDDYLKNSELWNNPLPSIENKEISKGDESELKGLLQKKIDNNFSFWGITLAGIADGINPCAIATMIFLISFLATQKRKKSEVLIVGLTFTLAVFVTYTLLGAGAFKGITALKQYHFVSLFIKWSAVIFAGGIGLISFFDAFTYGKSKDSKKIKLQLPTSIKKQIHKVISGNLKSGNLIWGALVTGFLVTLLEAVCTGQVYLPTIALMTQVDGFQEKGWLLLIYYNFLFVLPLIIVMFAAYAGLTWDKLAKTTQKNLVALKIILGSVMILLALFLAMN